MKTNTEQIKELQEKRLDLKHLAELHKDNTKYLEVINEEINKCNADLKPLYQNRQKENKLRKLNKKYDYLFTEVK